MIRVASLTLFLLVSAVCAERSAFAQLPVAPPPREIRPDGTRDPAPQTETPVKSENPAVVVDRIIKNSKDVGDKLAKTDTSTDTRKTQDKILSDIDSLINQQENPPSKSDNNKDKEQNKDKEKNQDKDKNNEPKDKNGMEDMKQNDMPKENEQPKSGNGNNRRPRTGDSDNKKEQNKSEPKSDPMNEKKNGQPKQQNDSKNPSGSAGGNPGDGKASGKPSLPFDEDVAKNVWGHLPDKLRQQMTQYYKEDVMPKYAELLRLYYSSLSDKPKK